MNQQKSLINLLLVSTAALSGYKKGANTQYKYTQNDTSYRNENAYPSTYSSNMSTQTTQATTNASQNMNQNTYTQNTVTQNTTSQNTTATSNNAPLSNMTPISQVSNPIVIPASSATTASQIDNNFLPAFLAALYAADEAVYLYPEATGPFELPPLEYNYEALEPYISAETLRIHHDKLHRKYVDNLNSALARYPEFYAYTLSEFLLFPDRLPSDIQTQVRHNAGGHYNHSLTWKLLGPANKTRPTGEFAQAIDTQFGSFENFKRILKEAAMSVVGTGYAWLALNPCGRMIIVTAEEQLTPIPLRSIPLLPIDVWEHAYFLDYEENRSNFLDAFFNLVNWERVGDRYTAALDVLKNTNELIC